MADSFPGLGREVERLVTAPYAPSLQDLHGLVQDSSPASLSSWALYKPCQVGALADILVDGLFRSNFALGLIGAFARLEAFRNALLERYPYILDQFLQRSIQNGETQYISICVAMLSTPLPSNFVVPACLASFITHLISSIGENPCAETVLPLYQLMTGLRTHPRVLLEVPSEIMSNLQVELTKTLRNLDDHTGNLLCLATFAQIASSKIAQVDNGHEQCPPWLQNVKHFFGPKRGLKTLDLVVLRVILACSASCNSLTTEQASESIRLAIEICDIVEPGQRECWIAANSTKIAKLCEKVTRSGIDRGVQILGVTFLISLLPASALPHGITGMAPQWLLAEDSARVLEILPLTYISRLVETNMASSGHAIAGRLLDYVFRVSQPNHTAGTQSITTTQIARSILNGLQGLEPQLFSSTVAEVAVQKCRENIGGLVESSPRRCSVTGCQDSNICQASVVQQENDLLNEIFSFYLRSALSLKPNDQASYIPEMDTFALFISRASGAAPDNKCQFWGTKPLEFRDAFSSLKIHDESPSLRQDWRTGISETLMRNSRAMHDDMVQNIENICYDLEKRCNDVEAPLRAVEEERNRLSIQAEELNSHNKELCSQLQQASGTIYELRQNISRLESQGEAASDRIDKLSASLEAARKELNDQRLESQESANSDREQARSRELDLIASLTEKEEQLEDLQERFRGELNENGRLTEILDEMTKEHSYSLELKDSLEQELTRLYDETKRQMEEAEEMLSQKEAENELLLAAKREAEDREEALQNKLSQEALESSRLQSALEQLEESYKTDLQTLHEFSQTRISNIAAESEKQREEIVSLQADMQASASSASKELHTRDKKIQHLEKKIQHMRDERAAKSREFSEAQQHIGRLMTVMGFKPDPASSKPSGKQQRSRPTSGPSQDATEEMQTHSEGEGTQTPHNRDMESSDPNATPPGERSPKRPRDLAFSSTESPTLSRTSGKKSRESVSRRGTQQPRDRKVLEDATQNSQPVTQADSIPCSSQRDSFKDGRTGGVTDENHLQEIDLDMDLEFSKDFLFTSTSVSEANDHKLPPGTQR
ncbi:hypothetical protein P170DRAFT_378212 [Aspergillus steynii IBT 23096]|uniref:Uncharacterized protein n=1 Tax=Aspergillus steynii IBT 23096 TaxID=1392250 RepID=A0A2I2GHR5_9EURO|nr:uncharacterized protein P170DRAFT_378212 [Aspergillus steynii IBT 23096]PLB52423.1 hypothetical protein P170DRAFT_378212 [Aspergillus steynii IBT 23096]